MKKIVFLVLLFPLMLEAQTSKTMVFGGITRQYLECVPSSYTGAQPVPLVICLHGLGDNMTNFSSIAMHYVGDTAGFITLYPQAVTSPMGTAWNSGASYMGYILNGTIDDVGFVNALIDSTAAHYNVDLTRVYATGFSMGGFMCHRLACQLGGKIAAIASVAGTIGTSLSCSPLRPIPVCHFHGTSDQTVSYVNNLYGMDAEETVDYWVSFNNCDTTPVTYSFPNLVQDSITVESFFYNSPAGTADVKFYRATGADHQWLYPPANDLFYTTEIWDFLRNYSNATAATGPDVGSQRTLLLYPNPAASVLYAEFPFTGPGQNSYTICNSGGVVVMKGSADQALMALDISTLRPGLYLMYQSDGINHISRTFIISR